MAYVDKATFRNLIDIARNLPGEEQMDGDIDNHYEFHSGNVAGSPGVGISLHIIFGAVVGIKVTPSMESLYPDNSQ
jgi:hypothetical protein